MKSPRPQNTNKNLSLVKKRHMRPLSRHNIGRNLSSRKKSSSKFQKPINSIKALRNSKTLRMGIILMELIKFGKTGPLGKYFLSLEIRKS